MLGYEKKAEGEREVEGEMIGQDWKGVNNRRMG